MIACVYVLCPLPTASANAPFCNSAVAQDVQNTDAKTQARYAPSLIFVNNTVLKANNVKAIILIIKATTIRFVYEALACSFASVSMETRLVRVPQRIMDD